MFYSKELLSAAMPGAPELIENYFRNVPAEALDIRRSETAWTLREHLYHLAGVQEMLCKRIQLFLEEEHPVIKPYIPDENTEDLSSFSSMEEAFAFYKEWRSKQMELITQLTEKDTTKEGTHPEFERYNIPILLNHILFHDYWHMFRVEELWLTKDEFFGG